MDFAEADEKLSKILRRVVDIPSLPSVVKKVNDLPGEEQSPRQLADLIATDQGLTAKVLRIVNSAFYSPRTPISSIRQASTMLGARTLKSLAMGVSVMSVFKTNCKNFDPIAFWRHSLCVAIASQRIGSHFLPALSDDLYAAGLLHDAGIALLVHYWPEEYSKVLGMARRHGRDLHEIELAVLGMTHAELAYTLVSRWKLPPLVCECVRHHVAIDVSLRLSTVQSRKGVEIVRFADRWAGLNGFDLLARTPATPGIRASLPEWLGGEREKIDSVLSTVASEVAEKELLLSSPAPAAGASIAVPTS